MKKYHEISNISISSSLLCIRIDNVDHVFSLETVSTKLIKASQTALDTYEISPSGYGLHWPLLDEDISVDGLLKIRHEPLDHTTGLAAMV